MCVAAPGQVLKINAEEQTATVSYFGTEKNVSIYLIPDVKINDWVLVHAGEALQIMDEEEAKETMEIWEEIYDAAMD